METGPRACPRRVDCTILRRASTVFHMDIPTGVWKHYGFSGSPYSTSALRVADSDESLLVGRDVELKTILQDLASGSQVVALEGDYGVGKSSLAAVAASQASRWRKRSRTAPLFLASTMPLELFAADTLETFERRVYYQVAGSILLASNDLIRDGRKLQQVSEFRRWLSTPEASSWSAGIGATVLGIGVSASGGRGRSLNSSAGFSDSGAMTLVDEWLKVAFPTVNDGGVILLLDNLEVMAKSAYATLLFESLRDRLFKRAGLRWIVSGAEGTVRVGLNTPKMSGVFPSPLDLRPIAAELVPDVIRRRANLLRVRGDAVLPVSPEAFEAAYLQTGKNLRVALGLAERFALRTDPSAVFWMTAVARDQAFLEFRTSEGRDVLRSLRREVTNTGWKVITRLVREMDGIGHPSDYPKFGYKTMSSLLVQIQPLADLGLVDYTVDEKDGRKRLLTVTERGRLAVASRDASDF